MNVRRKDGRVCIAIPNGTAINYLPTDVYDDFCLDYGWRPPREWDDAALGSVIGKNARPTWCGQYATDAPTDDAVTCVACLARRP